MRPNLIFILADDLGYADLGCYGSRHPSSPNLDALAQRGLRFTDAYANSCLCSPTRFALITGRYQYRLRGAHEEPLGDQARGSSVLGLPPDHPTLPSMLREAGYATALVGKWHLGYMPEFGPLRSGYDEFFGPYGGGVDYFTHCSLSGHHDLYEGEEEVQRAGYLTDLLSDRAADCVQRLSGTSRPFMLSLHYTAPHWPWERRQDEGVASRIHGAINHVDGGSVPIYYEMIQQMDEGIGRIVAALEAAGQLDNTLIVFTSDNGGERFSDIWPFVGKKMDLLEGGIRVPQIVSWPQVIPAGAVTHQTAITMDWVATMLEAADVPAHSSYPLDGMSLMPTLRNPSTKTDRELFWRMQYRQQRAMRSGDWKYLSLEGNEFLFNLADDARERANLGLLYPDRLSEMRARYERWQATMPSIASDAFVGCVYTPKTMATPST
ncbi:MAG: sulfatase family protein [Polaromonas sp.]